MREKEHMRLLAERYEKQYLAEIPGEALASDSKLVKRFRREIKVEALNEAQYVMEDEIRAAHLAAFFEMWREEAKDR